MTVSNLQTASASDTLGRILLAEDEPTNMAILSAYLRMASYDVTEAQDGLIAWETLEKDNQFDLLVTDRRMPNLEGLELAKKMKKDVRLRDIPIIMQTGATSQEEIAEGVKAGVYYYLSKPYEESTLVALVRSALQDRKQQEVFQKRVSRQRDAISLLAKGEFHVRTPEEAQNTALLLGSAFSRPELAVNGLYELLLNAIEHGNLGVGYETKNRLLGDGQWEGEILNRLALPENKKKKATVQFAQDALRIEVSITDDGPGFDWRPFMEIEPGRATKSNGRGIAKANLLSFEKLEYSGNGNTVKVIAV